MRMPVDLTYQSRKRAEPEDPLDPVPVSSRSTLIDQLRYSVGSIVTLAVMFQRNRSSF
jgi:hypothetical protein